MAQENVVFELFDGYKPSELVFDERDFLDPTFDLHAERYGLNVFKVRDRHCEC